MRSVLEIHPTVNFAMASPIELSDHMVALARVCMGLRHSLALVGQAYEVDSCRWDWPQPPTVGRRWYAVIPGKDTVLLTAHAGRLRGALEGIGLRCSDPQLLDDEVGCVHVSPSAVMAEDGYWASSLVMRRWPREVAPGWLGQALATDQAVSVGVHIHPQDPQRFARFLRKQADWQSEANATRPDAFNDLGKRDAESVRMKLIGRTDRPARVAIVLTARAKTRDELPSRVQALEYELGLALAEVRQTTWEQDRGLEATSLTGDMRIEGAWRTLDCHSVASTGIFQPTTVDHARGAPIGTSSSMLVRLNPFDGTLRSFGGLITGSVGSGKSFLLKLILMGLSECEMWVVEQSEPSEYAGIPGVRTFTLSEASEQDQATQLREFVTAMWDRARRDPRPRLLVLDELWSLLKRPELRDLVEEIARRGRKFYLSLWIATQQIEELLESAKAVYDNAAIRVYLQQEDRDLGGLARAGRLPPPARQFLRGAARGQALLYVNGMLVPVNVQATPRQYELANTDPRERVLAVA